MKHLRRICASAVLTLAFACSALAGDMECGDVPPPPPQQMTSTTSQTDTGITATNNMSSTTAVDPVTEAALNILQSVLSLF